MKTLCAFRNLVTSLFLMSAAVSVTSGQEGKSSLSLAYFEHLEGMLKTKKSSKYQHKTEIDERKGIINCDCSGLLGYALRQNFPERYLALKGKLAPWRSRPLAATFHESFERAGTSGDGLWKQIPKLMNAELGDILAWRKPVLKKGSTTGHVCIIAGPAVVESDGRIRIRVLDSTRGVHGNDTRKKGEDGLGAGFMWFEVNEEGEPIAFYNSETSRRNDRNFVTVGRLQAGGKIKVVTDAADQDLIGLDPVKAAAMAKDRGLTWRIIKKDDIVFPLPLSRYDSKRLNVVVSEKKVRRIRRG